MLAYSRAVTSNAESTSMRGATNMRRFDNAPLRQWHKNFLWLTVPFSMAIWRTITWIASHKLRGDFVGEEDAALGGGETTVAPLDELG